MDNILKQMINKYEIKNEIDEMNAIKEIIQEIILCGLSRGGFFKEAAFYGGTCLRIFYNLNRFSEDLDFSLLKPNKNFDLSKYFKYIEKEANSYGLNIIISTKEKTKESNITSAFLKADTKEHIIKFFPNEEYTDQNKLFKNIKVKFEVDINPPIGATYEMKYKLSPTPHEIRLFDESSLFAGKVHAILCRGWKTRVKGRDLYDYIFFLSNNIKVNLDLIKNKLIESNFISKDKEITIEDLKNMLNKKFKEIDYEDAKKDIIPFITDIETLNLWKEKFFIEITNNLKGDLK